MVEQGHDDLETPLGLLRLHVDDLQTGLFRNRVGRKVPEMPDGVDCFSDVTRQNLGWIRLI